MLGDVAHNAYVQSFQQCHTAGEAFAEVDFASHGAFRYFPHLWTYSGAVGEFVDNFGLYQSGIHVEAYQTAAAAEHIVLLQ